MARNIEIKARANDFKKQLALGLALSDEEPTILNQTDTFFRSPQGRLKLREFTDKDAQLIYYLRPNSSGPALSEYYITNTPNADELKHTLAQTLGTLAVVEKTRTLLLAGRTRLHFDEVSNLGEFIELEVVLTDADDVEQANLEAQHLIDQLGISPDDLQKAAYVDLLLLQQ